jgi:hypothetical protein
MGQKIKEEEDKVTGFKGLPSKKGRLYSGAHNDP